MTYVPDNYDLWEKHEAEQEEKLSELPVCDACGCAIQDDYCYRIGNDILCEECMKENFRVDTESLMD